VHQEELEDLVEVRQEEVIARRAGRRLRGHLGQDTPVVECLRYLLLAGRKLYLKIFKSKPFPPLRLGNNNI
jgi:hypothetical protein